MLARPFAPQANSISGTIPAELCRAGAQLRVLNLRSNKLHGPAAPVTQCRYLELLDLGTNAFTGALPSSPVSTCRFRCMARHLVGQLSTPAKPKVRATC